MAELRNTVAFLSPTSLLRRIFINVARQNPASVNPIETTIGIPQRQQAWATLCLLHDYHSSGPAAPMVP